jgi:hypothetical protein
MLPNLLIIGAGKCGTTSLHSYLQVHPEIFMSRQKELGYFSSDDWRERRSWYESHFADANGERIRGESTPQYTQHPFRADTAERVHELVPDAKLIYLVRDPITRLVSQWVELRSRNKVPDWEVWRQGVHPEDRLVATSRYAFQLQRYREYFPDERILVLDNDDLKSDRAATLRRVFAFLEVDDTFESDAFETELNTRASKGQPRINMRLWKDVVVPAADRLPPNARRRLGRPIRRLLTRDIERPQVDDELRARLEGILAPEVEWLRGHTGQKFAGWSI